MHFQISIQHPNLYELISRRFSKAGDVEFALHAVSQVGNVDVCVNAKQVIPWHITDDLARMHIIL